MAREQSTIERVTEILFAAKRYQANIYGSGHGGAGKGDILGTDVNGTLLAVECKRSGQTLKINQWRNMIRVLRGGGRGIVAYEDVTEEILQPENNLPVFYIGSVIGQDEFGVEMPNKHNTQEIRLKG